jgi:hypothetical protein
MDKKKQKFFNDYLEIITFFIFLLMLVVIYVPSVIWEEEDAYKDESRFRMQSVYNIENFYNILVGEYEEDGLKALRLVNAVRDSLTADSLFLGEQSVKLSGEEFLVNIPNGFDVEYDTTFGLRRLVKEVIVDTTVTVLMLTEDGVEDILYVQQKNLSDTRKDPSFLRIAEKTVIKVTMLDKDNGEEVVTTVNKEDLSEIKEDPLFVNEVEGSEEIVPAIDYNERIETTSYFNRRFRKERDPEYNFVALPDSSQFNCPLTNEPYIIEISPNSVRVSSPIRSYRDNRYGFFSLKTRSHGYIIDGTRSWDN